MGNDIHTFADIGIVLSMAYPALTAQKETYLDALKRIVGDPFFDLVELGPLPDRSIRGEVRSMVETSGTYATYGGQGILLSNQLNINSLVETKRAEAVEALKEGIDEAYELGCVEFQFLSRFYEVGKEQAYLEALITSTEDVCTYAKSKGDMKVVLEVFDHTIDKKSLLGPASLVRQYAQAASPKWENFGIMVDCSHIPMIGETIDEAIDPVVEFIRHVHIGNTLISDPTHPSYGDYHPRFNYPGGENDTAYLAEFLKKLIDVGYLYPGGKNMLSFEVKPQAGEDPDLVVASSKRVLQDAWRMLQ